MQLLLIIVGFLFFAFKAQPLVTAMVLASTLVVTYVAQTSVKFLTGVESSAMEVFNSVGLGVLFMILVAFWQTSFNAHFSGSAVIDLGALSLLAYAGGFMIGMGINLLQACLVSAVTTATSVLLFLVLRTHV